MTVGSKSRAKNQAVSLSVIIISLIALLVFLGWLYQHNFAESKGADVPISAEAQANDKKMRQIYQNSGGDLSRVSPEDRAWLHEYTRGREQEAFDYYKGRRAGPTR
ncbi:MAG TPA: hypothetical protein VFB21_21625 [Chthonomonadaceae bacterium]|nr:hypothetical protein [Chthonomonadaceae bacterium]